MEEEDPGLHAAPPVQRMMEVFVARYQRMIDRTTPFVWQRWVGFTVMVLLYLLRVRVLEGFYIVTYALGIYLLHLLVGFLTPQVDPAMAGGGEDAAALPTSEGEEFRPFMRALPEFKFWHSGVRAIALSMFVTLFPFLDIPVFWPILLAYFLVLFFMTMRKRVEHMIKFKYLPFSLGKKKW